MRILVTGHEGYIGSVMAPALAERGHDVAGLDTGYFASCTLVADSRRHSIDPEGHPRPRAQRPWRVRRGRPSRRAVERSDRQPQRPLDRGDQLPGVRPPGRAREGGGSRAFPLQLELHHVRDVERGRRRRDLAARSEDRVRALEGEGGAGDLRARRRLASRPSFLRNGTVYGLSPRMRFDTVFNDLDRPGGHHRQGGGLRRRQAVAPGRARAGRRAGVCRRARRASREDPQ